MLLVARRLTLLNKEDQSMNEENKSKRFYTFKQWSDEKGDPSEGALRWMHHTNKDGFSDECVIRRGRRCLLYTSPSPRD